MNLLRLAVMTFPAMLRCLLLGVGALALSDAVAFTDSIESDQVEAIRSINDVYARLDGGFDVDWTKERAPIAHFIEAHPDHVACLDLVKNYMYAFETANSIGGSEKAWAFFEMSPNAGVAAVAKGKASFFGLAKQPIQLRFTGLDAQTVDFERLRGKIVLLDFWATWCPPCMRELPNVKRIYAKYHEKGFEIVGISCDVSPTLATGPVQAWMKTGPEVLEFTRAHGMPWPQNYEGRKHNEGGNTLAARFAVTGIPAAFLVGRDGRIQAMNLRGDRLDAAIGAALAH